MKSSLILFSLVLAACASPNQAKQAQTTPPREPKVLIHERTENFIDLEAPIGQVWIGCDQVTLPEENSFLSTRT